ncbi:MAG: Na+/H+ antiporter NhaA [Gammaproteobacteria bacterium]
MRSAYGCTWHSIVPCSNPWTPVIAEGVRAFAWTVYRPFWVPFCSVCWPSGAESRRPGELSWEHVTGAGAPLGGSGFTMSIFITALAFDKAGIIAGSQMAVLLISLWQD